MKYITQMKDCIGNKVLESLSLLQIPETHLIEVINIKY